MTNRDTLGVIVLYAIMVVIVVAGWLIFSPISCAGRTNGMSIPHRWKLVGGCQVRTVNGWVPLENYRAL